MSIPHDFTSSAFARTILDLRGEAGRRWLADLPALVDECAERWSLVVAPPFPELSFNYVAPAVRADGTPVVLKLGVPHPELTSEVAALRHYDRRGAARLLEGDEARGVLLLERLTPGTMLSTRVEDEAGDDAATLIAAQVMRDLWRPPPAEASDRFTTVKRWAQGLQRLREEFDGGCGPFPRRLVEQAETLFDELLASSEAAVLLHGDLHHYNILLAGDDRWLAIDPKGVLGEPCYEVGALMRNPFGVEEWPDLSRRLERRADILAGELGFDRQRILGWTMAQAVLSAWWSYEDSGGDGSFDESWLAIAEAAATLA